MLIASVLLKTEHKQSLERGYFYNVDCFNLMYLIITISYPKTSWGGIFIIPRWTLN